MVLQQLHYTVMHYGLCQHLEFKEFSNKLDVADGSPTGFVLGFLQFIMKPCPLLRLLDKKRWEHLRFGALRFWDWNALWGSDIEQRKGLTPRKENDLQKCEYIKIYRTQHPLSRTRLDCLLVRSWVSLTLGNSTPIFACTHARKHAHVLTVTGPCASATASCGTILVVFDAKSLQRWQLPVLSASSQRHHHLLYLFQTPSGSGLAAVSGNSPCYRVSLPWEPSAAFREWSTKAARLLNTHTQKKHCKKGSFSHFHSPVKRREKIHPQTHLLSFVNMLCANMESAISTAVSMGIPGRYTWKVIFLFKPYLLLYLHKVCVYICMCSCIYVHGASIKDSHFPHGLQR